MPDIFLFFINFFICSFLFVVSCIFVVSGFLLVFQFVSLLVNLFRDRVR